MNRETDKALTRRIAELESIVAILQERIDMLEGVPSLRAGMRGESLVAELVNGRMTIHTAPHDVVVTNGIKLEVKFSRLNIPNRASDSRRWSWNHPLGLKQGKDFDRLLLVGEADPRYRDDYKDPDSPYVIFDVPRDRVVKMNQGDNHLSITTNPNRGGYVATTRRLLFECFQTTLSELESRYGIARAGRGSAKAAK
jgi:hypothetical protein